MTAFSEAGGHRSLRSPSGAHGRGLDRVSLDRPERFTTAQEGPGRDADGGCREMTVTSACATGPLRPQARGVDSIDAAEGFRGLRLALGEKTCRPWPRGPTTTTSCAAWSSKIRRARRSAPSRTSWRPGRPSCLVVRGPSGERLVPFAEPFIRASISPRGASGCHCSRPAMLRIDVVTIFPPWCAPPSPRAS